MISNTTETTTQHFHQTPSPQHNKLNQTQPVKEIDIDVQRPVINSNKMIRRSELSTINDQSFVNTSPVRLDENNNEMTPSKHEKNEITLITANINITTRLNNTNHHHSSTPAKPHDLFDSKQTPVPPLSTIKSVANRQTTTHHQDKLMLQHMHDSRMQQLYGVKEANLEMHRLDITNSQMKRAHFVDSPPRMSPASTNLTQNTAVQLKTWKKQVDDFRRDLIAEARNTSKTNEEFPPESESIYITPDTSPSNIMDESKVKEEKTSPVNGEPAIKEQSPSASKLQEVKKPSMTAGVVTRVDKSSQDYDEYLYLYMSSEKYAKIFERRFIELDRLIHHGKFISAILLTSLPPVKSDLELLSELYGANVILDRRSVQCYIKLRKEILESFKNALIKIGENKYLFMKNICFTTSFPKHEFRSNYQV